MNSHVHIVAVYSRYDTFVNDFDFLLKINDVKSLLISSTMCSMGTFLIFD